MLASRGLPKGNIYSACVRSVMLYASETWPLKEENVIRLDRIDTRIVRWMCNVKPDDRISAEELRSRLNLKSMWEYLKDRRLRRFGHPERTEGSVWYCHCRTLGLVLVFPQKMTKENME